MTTVTPSGRALHRVVNLIPDSDQSILNMTVADARNKILSNDPTSVLGIRGAFALMARDGQRVCLARSLNRPLRYFLAKEAAGPLLVVSDRIDTIHKFLVSEGYAHQFHPTYTRMAPAHHITEIQLIGCPDPNPTYRRFFAPPMGTLPPDLDTIGRLYVEALLTELREWLSKIPDTEPLGVAFSGGLDSGTMLLCVHDALRQLGQSPARLKAFTLSIAGGGDDAEQSRAFLHETGLDFLAEEIVASAETVDPLAASRIIEDYKPLDVECAAAGLSLLQGIRDRYPDWRWLVDGDGGDENLKDYPIEDNTELTIRSVVSNRMLYQEGWGVDAIKHSQTYSGGLSRGCVRGYAPARHYEFEVISPCTSSRVIAVAEAIPFDALTAGSTQRLYALKGEVLARGVRLVLGRELPVFRKRRFQEGAMTGHTFQQIFGSHSDLYRHHVLDQYTTA